MPDLRYKNCKGCGKRSDEVGPLSWTRLCVPCAKQRAFENNDQISAKSGPYYEHLQRRRIMAARQALLAAEREKG